MDQPQTKEVATAKPSFGPLAIVPTNRSSLKPASKGEGTAHLASCLVLVSPSGMTADEREEWLKAARMSLSGIPADLLAEGCAHARLRCRFPSEIVPTIMDRIGKRWKWRRDDAERARLAAMPKQIEPDPDYVGIEEIQALIKSIGSAA